MNGEIPKKSEAEIARQMMQWALNPDPSTEKDGEATGEIPGYEIEKILGKGGMGAVYKAHHTELGRVVAIKIFTATSEDTEMFVERLRKEGRLMAQLEHDHVLGIYDAAVTEEGVPYLVLEYIDGMDLFSRMQRKKRLPESEAIRIATAVCDGLSAVHELGIVHRDIKPANILLGYDGSIKVSDFGISKDVSDEEGTQLTLTGTTVGTVDYMSPEHAAGKELDARADIYSVGVMLYEMLSGVTPRGAFEPLSKYKVSRPMQKLVTRCLQRDRDKRPASARNVVVELRKIKRATNDPNSQPWKIVAAAVGGVVAAVTVLAMVMRSGDKSNQDDGNEEPTAQIKPPQLPRQNTSRPNSKPEKLEPSGDPVEKDPKAPVVTPKQPEPKDLFPVKYRPFDLMGAMNPSPRGWKKTGDALLFDGSSAGTWFTTIDPGENYAVRVKWRRTSGYQSMALFLPTKRGAVSFEVDAWNTANSRKRLMGIQGFKMFDDSVLQMNQVEPYTGIEYKHGRPSVVRIDNDKDYLVEVNVSGDDLYFYLIDSQGKKTKKGFYRLSEHGMEVPSVWGVGSPDTIGVGAYHSGVKISELKVTKR